MPVPPNSGTSSRVTSTPPSRASVAASATAIDSALPAALRSLWVSSHAAKVSGVGSPAEYAAASASGSAGIDEASSSRNGRSRKPSPSRVGAVSQRVDGSIGSPARSRPAQKSRTVPSTTLVTGPEMRNPSRQATLREP